MKRIFIFLIAVSLSKVGVAQSIDFYSERMEFAVKDQLGLEPDDILTRAITESVTELDLSAYELEDIRDIVYFPNLQRLDLSYNRLENISALVNMQHLSYLNLSGNRLRSLSDLAFSESEEMLVLIAGNYISDYELILDNPNCFFTIIGLNFQEPLYRVTDFYADFDLKTSQKVINYNVWTYNEYESLYLSYDGKKELITSRSSDIQVKVNISDDVVYINHDNQSVDAAYFISPTSLEIKGKSTVIAPNIPVNNKILLVESSNSIVSFSDNSVFFEMQEGVVMDTVRIGFGKGEFDIKGYTYYYVKSGVPTGTGPTPEGENPDNPTGTDPTPEGEKPDTSTPENPTGTETISKDVASAYFYNNLLVINTSISEDIQVYTLEGVLVYQARKEAGEVVYNVSNIPDGVMIVRGSSGWVKRVLKK